MLSLINPSTSCPTPTSGLETVKYFKPLSRQEMYKNIESWKHRDRDWLIDDDGDGSRGLKDSPGPFEPSLSAIYLKVVVLASLDQ